ncbi:MAG TPA: HAMP domain-containing sensor histidine kinase, partial [Bacteroidales bacterium]|nr:HAMP domain-containing sensor histidine kinase [Bacteroidales bacterium]
NDHLEDLVKDRTKELEIANHQLSILDQAKSNFLLIISHEIRTPLNGVIGLTELLDNTNIDKNQKEYLNYLKEVSSRLVKFSDTALLITSLKINDHIPEILSVSINQVIADSIVDFQKNNSESSLQITNNMPSEDLLIKVDSNLMKTCFMSIIENSAKFAGETAHIDISANISDNSISLKFCDNGPGFSDDAFSHLFELFSAGDILHKEGTGLGLATAKLILDAHDGTIDVKNVESGGGAEVNIKLKYSLSE